MYTVNMEIDALLIEVKRYQPDADTRKIRDAYEFAKAAHKGQKRESGEPFAVHLIRTAMYLARLECGLNTLIAGLLHDVVEDGAATLKTVQEEFGEDIAKLVDAVTKLTKLRYAGGRSERQIQSLRKMLLAASDETGVVLLFPERAMPPGAKLR